MEECVLIRRKCILKYVWVKQNDTRDWPLISKVGEGIPMGETDKTRLAKCL